MIQHSKIHPFQCRLAKMKAIILIFIAVSALTACSKAVEKKDASNSYKQSASLITISPEKSYTIARNYLGQITAKQHTNLSFEYSGRISNVLVDSGDVIKKGQLLAQQDTQLLSYKTTELQSQKNQAQAQITLNQANLRRIKTLINDGYSSLQRLDELNSENQILKAQINGLNARINTLQYQREKSALIAPFDGVITERFISNGEVTTASQPSFRFIENANNEINVGIPRKVASTLVLGQVFEIKIDNIRLDNQPKQAKLIAIGQQINTVNRTVQLRLKMLKQLDKANSYNGQLVRVTIVQEIKKPGFWLPLNAITDGVRGQWQLFIATPTGGSSNSHQLQAATVNVLHTSEHSAYINGLSLEPHKIVAQGVHRYVGGQVVKASTQALANIPDYTIGSQE
ncbi:efflux RND transporter periplasmic adaptor subunit [Candidatus Colwellia aromaticivorans]|uniref:efflux RND transporter periplasmic adaptor subunit n=1 Tax=Candidatus Colwellia aromaticivorans TaxID=2267621 RepID=UPI000DF40EAD|nr:efflux RND transporter periplasmic adaptor subunit [Candidatus Colwellia aromaticivorans]